MNQSSPAGGHPPALSAAEQRRLRMRQEMRDEILAGARRLIDAHGADALTMRAVADEIGYSTGALYEYFRSKDELCAALFFQGAEGLAGHMERAIAALPPDASFLERLSASGAAYRRFALENPDLYRMIFSNQAPASPGVVAEEQDPAAFATLVDLVAEGIERGELRREHPARLAVALWASVHGFVMLGLTGHLPDQPEGIRDELFQAAGELLDLGLVPRDSEGASPSGLGFAPASRGRGNGRETGNQTQGSE